MCSLECAHLVSTFYLISQCFTLPATSCKPHSTLAHDFLSKNCTQHVFSTGNIFNFSGSSFCLISSKGNSWERKGGRIFISWFNFPMARTLQVLILWVLQQLSLLKNKLNNQNKHAKIMTVQFFASFKIHHITLYRDRQITFP